MLGFLPSGFFYFSDNFLNSVSADDTGDGYAAFADGSTYTYTDYEKFEDYRTEVLAENAYQSTGDDTTTVDVDRSAVRGSQENPYVINSFDTWKTFSDEMGVTSESPTNWGDGKYFVLACDLDFATTDTVTITPTIMYTFCGTFYGLGHSIKNYHITETSANNEGATGMFRYGPRAGNRRAVFADLNLENFTIDNAYFNQIGALYGVVAGDVAFIALMNCHVTLSITTVWVPSDANLCVGGLIGNAWYNSYDPGGTIYAYRCSSQMTVNAENNTSGYSGLAAGGIVGAAWHGYAFYAYDCYGEVSATMKSSSSNKIAINGCGAILGSGGVTKQGEYYGIEIMRCAGRAVVKAETVDFYFGSLFTYGDTSSQSGTATVRNCYTYGHASYFTSTATYTPYPWQVYSNLRGSSVSATYSTVNAKNVFYAGKKGASNVTWGVIKTNPNGSAKKTDESALWTAAISDTCLNGTIWNKSVLSNTYAYTIDNSPVRNKKFDEPFKIKFYNLYKDGNNHYSYTPVEAEKEVTYTYTTVTTTKSLGNAKASAAPSPYHTFQGWTTDKTGATAGVRTFDCTNYYGDLKVFAMWELTGITPTLTQSGGTLNNRTGSYEAESGGSGITLTANVTVPSEVPSENLSISYGWVKGTEVLTSHRDNHLIVENRTGNGAYSFQYAVTDSTMPLVKATGVCKETITVEITGKSTSLNKFEPTVSVYAGMLLKNIPFTLTMVDGYTVVPASAEAAPKWENENYRVVEGENTVNVIFTPKDIATYKVMTVPVTITPQVLTLTFHIESASASLVSNITYGRGYSATEIVEMFTAAYVKKIKEDPVFENSIQGRQPLLGDGVIQTDIDEYNKPLSAVTSPQTIEVTFSEPKDYNVLIDYGYDGKTKLETVHWNQFVPKPATPNRGSNWEIAGWFVTKNGTVTDTKWSFENDRVTKDTVITATWTQIVLTPTGITVTTKNNPFTVTALTPVHELGLTVTATYSSSVSSEPVTRVIPLKEGSTDGYEVSVGDMLNGSLHVNTTQIEVSYNGFTQTVPVTVTPISLDDYRRFIDFPVCTKDYKQVDGVGVPQEIDPLLITSLPEQVQPYVNNIVISYAQGGKTLEKNEVVAHGTYEAIATFVTNEDYTLSPVRTSFIISPPRLAVTVSWTHDPAGYTYNGFAQYPKATLTIAEGENSGTVLGTGMYEYTILNRSNGKSDGIGADSYTIKVVFTTNGAKSYKFQDVLETTTRYTVEKMKVAKPTAARSSFPYTGDQIPFLLDGFESSYTSYSADSTRSAKDAGSYSVTVQLDKNHEWIDGGSTALFPWTIEKAKIARPTFSEASVVYNGFEQDISKKLGGFDATKMQVSGGKERHAGTYTANVTPTSNYTWDDNGTPVSVSWMITKKPLFVDWNITDTFRQGDEKPYPTVKKFRGLVGSDSFDPVADADAVVYNGADKYAVGGYVVSVYGLDTLWAEDYEIDQTSAQKGYRIISETADPDDPNNPQVPDVSGNGGNTAGSNTGGGNNNGNNGGNGGNTNGGNTGGGSTGENPSGGTVESIPQIIISGIALVLIIVFTVMTLNYATAAKNAMAKTKRLAQVTYSFAPAALLAPALGISDTGWWAIAAVLVVIALVMGIVAFLFRNKKIKAVALLEEEQERVDLEREYAKEEKAREEQAHRDNELRMMFAAMQQNSQQPQINYEAIQGMISSTVSALLPAVQQQFALPPAPSAPTPVATSSPETDELRAQIAQQQQLLNQILENQKQQSYAETEPIYAEPYEEPVDDTSWVGEGEEVVSLEESYGNLSDEGKLYYYEIGSHIMNKPRTSQNDGKYAVLFKYRGKTLFKLCILNDAPVLYYPLGNGGRGEVRIADPMSLELAKSVIDRYVIKVDNELG